MPDTDTLVYWLLQVCLVGLVTLAWREVRGLRNDLRQNQRVNNWLRHMVLGMYSRCQYVHPEKPIFPMPEDPDSQR